MQLEFQTLVYCRCQFFSKIRYRTAMADLLCLSMAQCPGELKFQEPYGKCGSTSRPGFWTQANRWRGLVLEFYFYVCDVCLSPCLLDSIVS